MKNATKKPTMPIPINFATNSRTVVSFSQVNIKLERMISRRHQNTKLMYLFARLTFSTCSVTFIFLSIHSIVINLHPLDYTKKEVVDQWLKLIILTIMIICLSIYINQLDLLIMLPKKDSDCSAAAPPQSKIFF